MYLIFAQRVILLHFYSLGMVDRSRISAHGFQARKLVLLMACIYYMPIRCDAQYLNIDKDSIRREIAHAGSDSAVSGLYGVLGWELRYSNQHEAVRLADEMIRISSPVNDYLRLAEAYRIKGFVKVVNQDLRGCQEMYALGIDYAMKAGSHYYLASFYSLTGGMYQDKGDFDTGIRYYLDALK
ncbi:MAG: hypothetical protein JO301_08770, partial [Chitinophagaceae bacterium]|nr:hypothetical protein [Chitinophagaceae bacterium]